MKYLCVFIWFSTHLRPAISDDCTVSFSFPATETPLFLSPFAPSSSKNSQLTTTEESFVQFPTLVSDGEQTLDIAEGTTVVTTCPGDKNHFSKSSKTYGVLSCDRAGQLSFDKKTVDQAAITCIDRPEGSVLHTKKLCYGERDGTLHVIGWRVNQNWFIPHITICWDPERETTLYAKHTIYGSSLNARIPSPGRPNFNPGSQFSQDVEELFPRQAQEATFTKLLGGVPKEGVPGAMENYYFARGHLAPDADFILPSEQDATYFFINAVPQFQKFNNGNWKSLEDSIRQLAEDRASSLTVYTGTLGILTLKDVNNNDVDIFLDPENQLYPAPNVIWKVIYDPKSKEAIAILGLNSIKPDRRSVEEFQSICKDICSRVRWINRKTLKDLKRGAIICCEWNEFAKQVPRMVNLGRVSVLAG